MRLTEREIDKLLIFTAAEVARRRRERGLKLNHPEAVAFITAAVLEGIRDGRSVGDLMTFVAQILGRGDVLDGVAEMIPEIQVEGTFPDGTKLVTIHDPIRYAHEARRILHHRQRDRAERRPRPHPAARGQRRRPPDPGRIAHALLRGQPVPALRSPGGVRTAAGHSGRYRAALRTR